MKEENVKPITTEGKTKSYPYNREVTKEAQEERLQLSALLIGNADDLAEKARQRKIEREKEEIELRSGKKISIEQIQEYVTALTQPYAPKFPNSVPFFSEMYRLLRWTDKNPNDFTKPAIVGGYINELIYHRFHKDVLPALQVMAMPGGVRRHKFFQYLNEDGQKKVAQFRDEAIAIMRTCKTFYEFRLKYAQQYNLPVQLKLRKDF
jgi:hypothetical protein